MVNKDIASSFNLLAALMELHGENSFKTKAYANAFLSLRKWDQPLAEMSDAEIASIPGIGTSVASKIRELLTKGAIEPLEKLKSVTPIGIQQLLTIKGLGPKKIRVIWDELGVESPAELLYACTENRLVKLSGFGLKTQEDLQNRISYYLDSQDRYLYGAIENELNEFILTFQNKFHGYQIELVGEAARKTPVITAIECLITPEFNSDQINGIEKFELNEKRSEDSFTIQYDGRLTIHCHTTSVDNSMMSWSKLMMSPPLYEKISVALQSKKLKDMDALLSESGYADLPFELMDHEGIESDSPGTWADLVSMQDIRGVVHNHSTWSDGIHTLEEMATHVRDMGYEYFGITDHSRSAFYANGLQPDRVVQQMEEIDKLNSKLAPFKIYKGIESDILTDGALDYEDDMLRMFDIIVASVHSNLRMDEEKATTRLIKAVENPYTRILGHPTGRLLLARPGYPINYRKVIDACAANKVVIELNSNPQRMDIDYAWLQYCQDKGVLISINPDAHSRSQIGYVKFGVLTARKGLLKKENCLNARKLDEFQSWVDSKRSEK
ncbi:MAG: helix-hairpin-helix domain-containing protein [Saprospiraceae bacterium]